MTSQGPLPAEGPDRNADGPAREAEEALRGVPVLSELDAELVGALAARCAVEAYEPGEVVFTMGQTDDALYVVLRGEARLTRADGERGDISVVTVTEGDWIGLDAFALRDGALGRAALQAVGAVELLAFDTDGLRELALGEGALAFALLRASAMAGRASGRAADPHARVYRHLLGLVRRSAGGAFVPEMPRHAALAEAAGVCEADAAGAVAELISRGVAKRAYPGLQILDGAALHRAAYD